VRSFWAVPWESSRCWPWLCMLDWPSGDKPTTTIVLLQCTWTRLGTNSHAFSHDFGTVACSCQHVYMK
jgi:hypothetical protein